MTDSNNPPQPALEARLRVAAAQQHLRTIIGFVEGGEEAGPTATACLYGAAALLDQAAEWLEGA